MQAVPAVADKVVRGLAVPFIPSSSKSGGNMPKITFFDNNKLKGVGVGGGGDGGHTSREGARGG